jgi:hypothetical protein
LPRTRFASLPAPAAWACLAALAWLVAWGFLGGGPTTSPRPEPGQGDVALYQAVVARIQAGEAYYPAAAAELEARGYPLRPFPNFRLPTLAVFLGSPVGDVAGIALFVLVATAAVLAWLRRLFPGIPRPIAIAVPLLTGAACLLPGAAPIAPLVVFHELWASILILLSLGLWRPERWWPSVLLGLAALLVRELALPYLVVMGALAWWDGRRREALAWAGAVAVFAIVLAGHAHLATLHAPGPGRVSTWLALGGWPFVLATSAWALPLLALPTPAHLVLVPLAFLGLAGWRGALGLRAGLVVAAYAGAFLVVGRPDNHYWGMLYAQLLIPGLLMAAPALRDLLARALPRPAPRPRALPPAA